MTGEQFSKLLEVLQEVKEEAIQQRIAFVKGQDYKSDANIYVKEAAARVLLLAKM